ncbi:MAG: hypothetical protein U0414_44265 [Polyangiaceae bacterium]
MFHEIQDVPQHPDSEGRRRWFRDAGWDLIVWYDASDQIRGFQLCYDTEGAEHALTWHRGERVTHQRVDSGEDAPRPHGAPVLLPGLVKAPEGIFARFSARAAGLDREILATLSGQLAGL